MKKFFAFQKGIYLLPFLLVGSVDAVLAGASISIRTFGGCGWYKKYSTDTKGKKCGEVFVERANDTGCSWAECWVEMYPCALNLRIRKGEAKPYSPPPNGGAFVINIGYANSKIYNRIATLYSNGGYGSYGFGGPPVHCNNIGWICMGGESKGLVFPQTAPSLLPANNEAASASRQVKLKFEETEYAPDSRVVIVRNFEATLRNNPYDKINEFSALYLSLGKSLSQKEDSLNRNEEDFYRAHVLNETRVLLRNGQLTIDGILQKATVETRDSAGFQIATIKMAEVQLSVPENADPYNVSIYAGTDVGILEAGIEPRFLPSENNSVFDVASAYRSSEVLEFSNYPNPSDNFTTVEAEVAQTQQVRIELYNQQNTMVQSIYSGQLEGDSRRSFPVNMNLPKGIYYLRLTRGNNILSRRVEIR